MEYRQAKPLYRYKIDMAIYIYRERDMGTNARWRLFGGANKWLNADTGYSLPNFMRCQMVYKIIDKMNNKY